MTCMLHRPEHYHLHHRGISGVSMSCTIHPQSPTLIIGGTVLKESDDLVILGFIFDSKMSYEKHIHSVSRAASPI